MLRAGSNATEGEARSYKSASPVIIGGEKVYHIILMSNIGSQSDPEGKSGLVHVCEHSALLHHMATHKYPSELSINGRTDFYSCSLHFSMPSQYVSKEDLIIDNIVNGKYLSDYYLGHAKEEVISECMQRKQYDDKMRTIISFVTDGVINRMPTGIPEDVKSIRYADALHGNPFSSDGSLIYLEYDSTNIHHLVFMPAYQHSTAIEMPKHEVKVMVDDGDNVRVYMAMPKCEIYIDVVLRTIAEYIFQYRMLKQAINLKKIFHKHFFREHAHLVIVFDRCIDSPLDIDIIDRVILHILNSDVAKEEVMYAMTWLRATNSLTSINDRVEAIRSTLSYGSPHIMEITHKDILDIAQSFTVASVSDYIHQLSNNIHIIVGSKINNHK